MKTIVRNLDLMNKLRSKALTIAGVTDQKESYFESQCNIAKEVYRTLPHNRSIDIYNFSIKLCLSAYQT